MHLLYEFLNNNHYHWGRRDDRHIWAALNGYKCFDELRLALDVAADKAGALLVEEFFDRHCGKTFYTFKHKQVKGDYKGD